MKLKYKDWTLTAKKYKTGWKAIGKRKTQYGIQTMTQKTPYSKTKNQAFSGVKTMIKFFYE